jgi:hypothetical protein
MINIAGDVKVIVRWCVQVIVWFYGCNWLLPEQFKYLGTTLTNQNSIQKEIKGRLKLGNACYISVKNLLSSRLLSKNLTIKIYRNIIVSFVLYGCETWSLTLREERRVRVLRRIFIWL